MRSNESETDEGFSVSQQDGPNDRTMRSAVPSRPLRRGLPNPSCFKAGSCFSTPRDGRPRTRRGESESYAQSGAVFPWGDLGSFLRTIITATRGHWGQTRGAAHCDRLCGPNPRQGGDFVWLPRLLPGGKAVLPVPTTHTVGQTCAISEQSLEQELQPPPLEGTCPPTLHGDSRVARARRTPAPRLLSWLGATAGRRGPLGTRKLTQWKRAERTDSNGS